VATGALKGKPNPKQKPKFHPIVKWLRTAGIAAELFGWGGLFLVGWFWPAVSFIYAGFLLLAVDVWFEPELRSYRVWRIGIVVVLIALTVAFSWAIVLVKAPLEISAFVTDAEYPSGKTIGSIAWRPEFTELQMWVKNPSNRNYEDVSLLIRPSSPIAAIAQLTNVPNVSFEDNNGFSQRLMGINPTAGKSTASPLVLLATDAGYRMHCPHLPAGMSIQVVIALADIKWNPSAQRSQRPIEEQARDKNYIFRLKFDDFSTYWQGHTDGDVYAPRPTSSEWVRIEGEYNVLQRTRSISQKIEVAGNITMRQP
jgi:hypothetical protein